MWPLVNFPIVNSAIGFSQCPLLSPNVISLISRQLNMLIVYDIVIHYSLNCQFFTMVYQVDQHSSSLTVLLWDRCHMIGKPSSFWTSIIITHIFGINFVHNFRVALTVHISQISMKHVNHHLYLWRGFSNFKKSFVVAMWSKQNNSILRCLLSCSLLLQHEECVISISNSCICHEQL